MSCKYSIRTTTALTQTGRLEVFTSNTFISKCVSHAGEWQTYDIIFIDPQFSEDSTLKSTARMTVFKNGVLVQNNVELWGTMQFIGVPKYQKHAAKEALLLQDHHNAVSFRNIWIREF